MDNANINESLSIKQGLNPAQRKQILKYSSLNFKCRMVNSIEQNHKMYKSFRKATICSKVLKRSECGEKLTSIYCKTKYCFTCNAIRAAVFIDKYSEPINAMKDAQFVTLTRKTCRDKDTPKQMAEMNDIWRKMMRNTKRVKFKRDIGSMVGIRKIEANLNANEQTHFHYHVIVDGKIQAQWLVTQWLKYNGKLSKPVAQDIRPVTDGAILEMAKYMSKMSIKNDLKVDYRRYARLFYQLRGKRSYQPFGGFRGVVLDDENFDEHLTSQTLNRVLNDAYFDWQNAVNDWVGCETGELFSGEGIPKRVRELWNDLND